MKNHINFRDYMNIFDHKATAYECLKCQLADKFPYYNEAYLQGKISFIKENIFEANILKIFRKAKYSGL